MSSDRQYPSVLLAEVATFINGDRSKNYPGQEDYIQGGIPFVSATDLSDGRVQTQTAKRISPVAFARLRAGKFEPNDVLFCLRGSIGKLALVHQGETGAIASSLVIVRAKESVDARFLYSFLRSASGQQSALSLNNGSAQPNVSVQQLQRVRLPFPPREVQSAIAACLGALDDRIELLRETNATLEAIAQALFKSWFVDFEPVRAKQQGLVPVGIDEATAALFPDSFEESALGPIPAGWQCDSLESIASVVMGLSPTGDTYNSEGRGVPLINGPVEFGEYFPTKTKWTESVTRTAGTGDLIFCVRGSTTGRRVVSDGEYCIGRGVCAIKPMHGLSSFLYKTIDFGLPRLLSKTTGSVFPSLSAPDIKGFEVLRPARLAMARFEEATAPLLGRIQANHRQARTLASIRDTLLPRLISGQLRLPEAEVVAVT